MLHRPTLLSSLAYRQKIDLLSLLKIGQCTSQITARQSCHENTLIEDIGMKKYLAQN
jgi:hypothetical protein